MDEERSSVLGGTLSGVNMGTVAQLVFPALAITSRGFLYSVTGAAELQKCSAAALKRGHFDGLRLIDAEGSAFVVKRAEKEDIIEGGWRRLGNPVLLVDLEIEGEGQLTLFDAKDQVVAAIRRFPDLWQATEDIADVESRVRDAGSIGALIEMFLGQT